MSRLNRRPQGVDIRDRAVLVHMRTTGFGNIRYDKEVTKQVDSLNESQDAGRYMKTLFTKEDLAGINSLQALARSVHHYYARPWIDGGIRILPSELFDTYTEEMNKVVVQHTDEVDFLCDRRDEAVAKAKKRLGKMFKPEEYPSKKELKDRYSITIKFLPIPDKSDFRADIPEYAKQEFEKFMDDQIELGLKELWERLHGVLTRAFEQLSKDKGKIYETVVSNIMDIVDVLPKLNITNDENLDTLVEKTKAVFEDADIDDLRKDKKFRNKKARETKELLDKMANYFND